METSVPVIDKHLGHLARGEAERARAQLNREGNRADTREERKSSREVVSFRQSR
jgi:hypothetical protein